MGHKTNILKKELSNLNFNPEIKKELMDTLLKYNNIEDDNTDPKEFIENNPEIINNVMKDVMKVFNKDSDQEIEIPSSEVNQKLNDLTSEDMQDLGTFINEMLQSD